MLQKPGQAPSVWASCRSCATLPLPLTNNNEIIGDPSIILAYDYWFLMMAFQNLKLSINKGGPPPPPPLLFSSRTRNNNTVAKQELIMKETRV